MPDVELGRDGNFQKIGPENRRFSLFKVSYECKEMYNSDLQPDGAQVQHYSDHIRWLSLDWGFESVYSVQRFSWSIYGLVTQLLWPVFVLDGRE